MMCDPSFSFVTTPDAQSALIELLGTTSRVAVDTEADSLHHYFEKVCLIQISVGSAHFVVDPLSDLDIPSLLAVLADKNLIFHGGDYDLRMLRMSYGFETRGEVFDTMLAAQLLGYAELGLAALVKRHFDIDLAKHGQKADWSKRPLNDNLLEYAYGDTRYLERLTDLLVDELDKLGRRNWHTEACRQMVRSCGEPSRRKPDSEWRIKGSHQLSPVGLALLKELWTWRDLEAQKADIPSFKVLSNQSLIDLVNWAFANPGAKLEQWPGLPRNYGGRRLSGLSAALKSARGKPAVTPTREPRETRFPQKGDEDELVIKALREKRDSIAQQLNLDPSILAPKAMLAAIAKSRPKSAEEILRTERMLPWQVDLLGRDFLHVIRSCDGANTDGASGDGAAVFSAE